MNPDDPFQDPAELAGKVDRLEKEKEADELLIKQLEQSLAAELATSSVLLKQFSQLTITNNAANALFLRGFLLTEKYR